MYKIKVYRSSELKYETDVILDIDLDGVQYSGIDYHNQEARQCEVDLLYDSELEALLEGEQREVKCGFHKLSFWVMKGNERLYVGYLAEDGLEIEHLNLHARLLKLRLIDWLGVILHLGQGVKYEVKDRYVWPLHELTKYGGVLDAIVWPQQDSENYKALDVYDLVMSLGRPDHHYWEDEFVSNWGALHVVDHVLVDAADYWYKGGWGKRERAFGFQYDEEDRLTVVLYEYVEGNRRAVHFVEKWQVRRFYINGSSVRPEALIEEVNTDPKVYLQKPVIGALHQHDWGVMNYNIVGYKAMMSGWTTLENVEVVPGEYDALELLGEYLRVMNAVLVLDGLEGRFQCRVRPESEVERIADPVGFELNVADEEPAEIKAVSLASQAIIDSLDKAYRKIGSDYPYGFTLKTNAEIFPRGVQEVMGKMWEFGGYRLMVLECSEDVITKEMEIRGRACKIK